jgi:hypothetical protein
MIECLAGARPVSCAALLFVLVASAPLSAQSTDELATYAALVGTPQGGLPPLMTNTVAGTAQRSVQLALRYGYLGNVLAPFQEKFDAPSAGREHRSLSQYAATVILPVGLGSTVSLSAGGVSIHCDDCHAYLTLGAGGDYRLFEQPFGVGADAMRLTIGVNGEFAYGRARAGGLLAGNVVTGTVGIPVGVIVGSGTGMHVVPFLTPAFGFANVGGGEGAGSTPSSSGTRFLVGGGVGVFNSKSSVQVSLGFQYVLIEGADTQVGLAITLGGR